MAIVLNNKESGQRNPFYIDNTDRAMELEAHGFRSCRVRFEPCDVTRGAMKSTRNWRKCNARVPDAIYALHPDTVHQPRHNNPCSSIASTIDTHGVHETFLPDKVHLRASA